MGSMDNREDKKNIHFNPDFIARRSETQVKSKFHVNPAFFQKSGSHKVFLQPVQQNLTSTGDSYVLSKSFHQNSSPPKPVQNLLSTIQTSSSINPVNLESYHAGSSSNVVYNQGNQRPVFVNSQCGYSNYTPQSQVSYVNSTKPSLYSWRTNPFSLPNTRIPVDSSSSSSFRYQCQSRVKDNVSKFDGNVSELAKSKFKVDNRTGACNVERTKQGFEKYCIIRESEKANINVLEKANSKSSVKAKSLGPCRTVNNVKKEFFKDKVKKINDSLPFAKSKGAYSLSNVKLCIDKPNSSSVTSKSIVLNPTYNHKNFTLVTKEPSHFAEVNANGFTENLAKSQFESNPRTSPVKSSNILINPILLKSLSSSDKVDILAIASKSSPKKMVPSLSSVDSKLVSVEKPSLSAVSKYKVISKTKLVRRRSRSISKTKLSIPAKETRPECLPMVSSLSLKKEGSHITLCRPSPVFPTRTHSILAKNHLKRRYAVLSRNKLVRRLSGSSSLTDDTLERPKYTIKTNTKLVKRYSASVLKSVKYSSKVQNCIIDNETKKNYMVLSKTKLIRRKSNVGVLKARTLKDVNKLNTRTIIRRHKLVRNVPIKSGKVSLVKNLDTKGMRRINTKYKIENRGGSLSAKQKAAKGIVSKYRINRLKVDSPALKRTSNKRFTWVSTTQKTNNLQGTKKRVSNSFSDRFVNIGGILYKATKTSLHKQITKEKMINVTEKGSKCILKLHGNQYSVSAGGRTLTRIESKPSSTSTPLLSRVHIGGLTYSCTKTGHYELTKAHQARAVLSSAKHRSMITLSQKKRRGTLQKRNQYCIFFNRFGRCTKKDKGDCPYLHDANRIAICTRFLRGRCPVSNCPFSHKIDPDKMPVCSHFVRSICTREGCPYRHVRVSPNAPFCIDFLHGHCPLGQECKKQHVLECEEFSTSGKCPRGEACPLSHRKGSRRKKKSISLEPVISSTSHRETCVFQPRRRKSSDSVDVLGEPCVKQKKKKVIVACKDGIPKRYFSVEERDLPHAGNGDLIKDTQNIGVRKNNDLNKGKAEIEMDMESSPFPGVSSDDSKEQLIANAEMNDEAPEGSFDLEQKRGKLLQKIDQLKEIYETPRKKESDGDKNENNKRKIHNITKETKDDVKDFKCDAFERRPLPKKMPSFISLSRDGGDVEDQ
ncbi:uncharacterized protein ZC3H3 isoform X2 [Palaemon carinicauda]